MKSRNHKVKVFYSNVLAPYSKGKVPKGKMVESRINDNTTLEEIFALSQEDCTDLTKYYNLSSPYYYNEKILPYIITSGRKIIWGATYSQTKVLDFVKTHNIKHNTIRVDCGIPQAGGPDLKEIVQLWNECYPIIDQISSALQLAGASIGIGKWIKSLFIRKKTVPPHSIFDFLFSRSSWNHYELATMLEITEEEAKKVLQAFGYKWDNSMKIYIQQPKTKKLIKKLSEVSVYAQL